MAKKNCCQCLRLVLSLPFSSRAMAKMKKVFIEFLLSRLFVSTFWLHRRRHKSGENLSFQHSMWPVSSASSGFALEFEKFMKFIDITSINCQHRLAQQKNLHKMKKKEKLPRSICVDFCLSNAPKVEKKPRN